MPFLTGGLIDAPAEVRVEEMSFAELSNAGGTYSRSVTVPAGSWLLDVRVYSEAVWTAATSATLIVGDAATPDGWYTGVSLLAGGLDVDEVLSFDSAGGFQGAYLDPATGLRNTMWSDTERVITASVTTVTVAGSTAGRTRVLVIWSDTTTPTPAQFA